MTHYGKLYIDGAWVEPSSTDTGELVNPATEEVFATVCRANTHDVDKAVAAARRAFKSYSSTSVEDRLVLIDRIIGAYEVRADEFADVIAREVGVPRSFKAQVAGPAGHMRVARDLLRSYRFETRIGDTIVRREPIGVCALIAPWNWPIQTMAIKLIYAIAAGCTSVLKPAEASPISSILLTEVIHEAGVPKGVVNLIMGQGSVVGDAMSRHPDVDFVSFTGSTRAGALVGEAAARTIKRVSLELGGKSANVVLPDADLEKAARWNIQRGFSNTGQSCHAPSRILVHESQADEILPYLIDEASRYVLGDPLDEATAMGPAVTKAQYDSIQRYIQSGLDEGARLAYGGLGRPADVNRGFFVRPTIFTGVTRDMTIFREEIFGPVLAVVTYRDEEEAINLANDSIYGLGGYVFSSDTSKGRAVANHLRAGRISFNGAATNSTSPMGGYKQSGIGRSMGVFGLEEYLEIKSEYGFGDYASHLPEIDR